MLSFNRLKLFLHCPGTVLGALFLPNRWDKNNCVALLWRIPDWRCGREMVLRTEWCPLLTWSFKHDAVLWALLSVWLSQQKPPNGICFHSQKWPYMTSEPLSEGDYYYLKYSAGSDQIQRSLKYPLMLSQFLQVHHYWGFSCLFLLKRRWCLWTVRPCCWDKSFSHG